MGFLYGSLRGKKTYLVSITGIVSALSSYLIGDIDIGNLMNTIFPLFSIIFLRTSIKEKKEESKQ